MKYTIEIPTLETIDTLIATAHRNAQAWMLENIANEIANKATIGKETYTLKASECPYIFNLNDINEVQNALREMGYMTIYSPKKNKIKVSWTIEGREELNKMKENNTCWKLPTGEELEKILNRY